MWYVQKLVRIFIPSLYFLSLTTPKENVSQVSDTGRLWITSGAIQGNVPTNDMCVVWVRNLDAPKSQIWSDDNRMDFRVATQNVVTIYSRHRIPLHMQVFNSQNALIKPEMQNISLYASALLNEEGVAHRCDTLETRRRGFERHSEDTIHCHELL